MPSIRSDSVKMDQRRESFRLYRQTLFKVTLPGGSFDIRVDHRSPHADALLKLHGKTTWAFITAWNPQPKVLSDAENFCRQAQLEAEESRR